MKAWHKLCMGLVACAGFTTSGCAQAPVAGGAAAAAPAGGAAAAAPAAAAPPAPQGFDFIRKCQEQKDICLRKFCATPLGQMFNSMMAPATAFSGGLIYSCCPTVPSKEELAASAGGEGGAAGA